jgi:hypothetical protein
MKVINVSFPRFLSAIARARPQEVFDGTRARIGEKQAEVVSMAAIALVWLEHAVLPLDMLKKNPALCYKSLRNSVLDTQQNILDMMAAWLVDLGEPLADDSARKDAIKKELELLGMAYTAAMEDQ